MNINKMIRQTEARMVAVGKERDKLDKLIDELTGLEEACARAYDALQEARDALSELT